MNPSPYVPMTVPQGSVVEKKHFDKVALIDADRLKHVICYDIYKQLEMNYTREEVNLVMLIEDHLARIYNQFSAKGMIFCFSGKSFNTFRYHTAINKEYKGNRKNDATDYHCKGEDMNEIVRYIMSTNAALLFPDLEADDILSMLQCEHTFIYSNDKDLKQIPGLHFNPGKLNLDTITEEEALLSLCKQMLTGDTVDNIGGLPGCGPVNANKIIVDTSIQALPSRILFEYQKKFGIVKGTDCFVENWNLIKLRTNRGDYFRTKYSEAFNLLNSVLQHV